MNFEKFFKTSSVGRLPSSEEGGGGGSGSVKMSIMYSDPLVIERGGIVRSVGDAVEYQSEIMSLTRYLSKVQASLQVIVRVANLDNLEEEVRHRTVDVLHIICHGDFDKKLQKYYLALETRNCELDIVTT